MPTYSYRCPSCGREYDRLQKMSDNTLVECPDCGTRGERQISAGVGFIFKGSGFYETDYKRKGESRTKYETGESAKSEKSEKSEKKEPAKTEKSDSDKPKSKDKPRPKTGEVS
jgi:putative FmdB family regulatory protein